MLLRGSHQEMAVRHRVCAWMVPEMEGDGGTDRSFYARLCSSVRIASSELT